MSNKPQRTVLLQTNKKTWLKIMIITFQQIAQIFRMKVGNCITDRLNWDDTIFNMEAETQDMYMEHRKIKLYQKPSKILVMTKMKTNHKKRRESL